MKDKISVVSRIVLFCVTLMPMGLCPLLTHASPYASCITITNDVVYFYLNEGGGNVMVTYEDGSTNATFDGVSITATNVSRGQHSFDLNGHTGYAIAVTKIGNGVPQKVSVDTDKYSQWSNPRGVAVNNNPKIGSLFGRIYLGTVSGPDPNGQAAGIVALNPDFTLAIPSSGFGAFSQNYYYGPWKMRVAPDNELVVDDASGYSSSYYNSGSGGTYDDGSAVWLFSSDLTSSNMLLGIRGAAAGVAAGIHGAPFGTPVVTGSLAASNLVLWTADDRLPVPTLTEDPNLVLGPGTSPGMYNNVFRYDIGAGPLPWTNAPNYAFNLGLDVIPALYVDVAVAPDGKVFPAFGRSNLSNPNITCLDSNGLTVLWNSWVDTGGNSDPFRGDALGSIVQYPYGGVGVSPDDQYFASMGIDNAFIIAKLTNGIPDDNTIFVITNTSSTGNARGMDWDIADNLYSSSSGQGLLREYSLGLTATCVTSNDITGTNGTFVIITPPVSASAVATVPTASQGYGTPTPGVITISLTTNVLAEPTTVTFTKSGTAAYGTNYVLNLGTNTDGVVITPTNVIFPAGTWLHEGNWAVDVDITPTPIPVSGPTLTATFTLLGGANYTVGGSTAKASVSIINTGPQLLVLSTLSSGTTFSRAVTNDYVKFLITRYGDTTVPTYTVTNINYFGTAIYPADYTAQAQRFTGSLLSDGSPGIVINSGEVYITNAIGNPLMRADLNVPPVNDTIVLSLTNAVTGTNAVSREGFTYVVSPTAITLTELDNALGGAGGGGGVTVWSSSLNNANDSTNWTLTYAAENLGTTTALPVVVPDYTNGDTSLMNGGTNDFDVEFGYPLPNNVPPSPAMIANGWTNVLKMTVNKTYGVPAAVNLYPQDKKFYGNYALRFSMYLSVWPDAIGNVYAGAIPREYALFGVNHYGTNCNWRPSQTASAGTSGVTNSDGIWFAVDAADNAATPADFDAFMPPAVPNPGISSSGAHGSDLASAPGSTYRGIFKNPPFVDTENPLGGEPVGQWVDVSVEITGQTNLTFKINGTPLTSVAYTGYGKGSTIWLASNGVPNTPYTNGDIMLGYLDPDGSIGDPDSQFVYYSDVRVLELSPYITANPPSVIVTNGATVSFTSSATYATAPLTNIWYAAANATTPVLALQTDTAASTNLTSTLTLTNVQAGTNYLAIFSDAAGSVTSSVAQVEVIASPTNVAANVGDTVQFKVIPNGPAAPTGYQWFTNGVALANSAHYAGVTNATLTITNVQLSDTLTYSVGVTNAAGYVISSATLTVGGGIQPPMISGVALVGTNAVLTFTTPNPSDGTSSYTLQSSAQVQGPYVDTTGVVTGPNGNGAFQFTVPLTTNTTMFYRLKHN